MTIHTLFRRLAPIAAFAGAAMVSGCNGVDIQIGDKDGVPLSELDMSGAAPTELVLAGPDKVIVATGDSLDIDVSGDADAVESLRFSLDGDTLGIHREKDSWSGKGIATVRITMPSLNAIVLAGSGDIETETMAGNGEVTVAGSGSVNVGEITAERFELTIAGSGDFSAAGAVDRMELTIAGSGSARMAELKAEKVEISVVGAGNAEFASDGEVEANIVGSGSVTVNGRAKCSVSAMGAGTLNCREKAETPGS